MFDHRTGGYARVERYERESMSDPNLTMTAAAVAMPAPGPNAEDFVQLLRDGVNGYTETAELVENAELRTTLHELRSERSTILGKAMRTIDPEYRAELDGDGTVSAALHRTWLEVKAAVAGDASVIKAAINAEEYAEAEIGRMLDAGLPEDLVLTAQAALDQVRASLAELNAWV